MEAAPIPILLLVLIIVREVKVEGICGMALTAAAPNKHDEDDIVICNGECALTRGIPRGVFSRTMITD